MAKVVVLGAGVSGHTAALTLKRKLEAKHEIIVVSPNSKYQWIPSNIWVGIGRMKSKEVTFELAPVYKKKHIQFHQAKAVSIHPEGDTSSDESFISIEYTSKEQSGQTEKNQL